MGKAKKPPPPPPQPPQHVMHAVDFLNIYTDKSSDGLRVDAEHQAKADASAQLIVEWAGKCDLNRGDLGNVGVVKTLVALMEVGSTRAQRDHATHALALLVFNNPIVYGGAKAYMPEFVAFDNVAAVVAADGVAPLVRCLSDSSSSQRQREHAATALSCVANNTDRRTAVASAGAIPALLALARNGLSGAPESALLTRHAVTALGSTCFCHEANQAKAASLGATPLLEQLAEGGVDRGGPPGDIAAPPGSGVSPALRQAAAYALRNLSSVASFNVPAPPAPA